MGCFMSKIKNTEKMFKIIRQQEITICRLENDIKTINIEIKILDEQYIEEETLDEELYIQFEGLKKDKKTLEDILENKYLDLAKKARTEKILIEVNKQIEKTKVDMCSQIERTDYTLTNKKKLEQKLRNKKVQLLKEINNYNSGIMEIKRFAEETDNDMIKKYVSQFCIKNV